MKDLRIAKHRFAFFWKPVYIINRSQMSEALLSNWPLTSVCVSTGDGAFSVGVSVNGSGRRDPAEAPACASTHPGQILQHACFISRLSHVVLLISTPLIRYDCVRSAGSDALGGR